MLCHQVPTPILHFPPARMRPQVKWARAVVWSAAAQLSPCMRVRRAVQCESRLRPLRHDALRSLRQGWLRFMPAAGSTTLLISAAAVHPKRQQVHTSHGTLGLATADDTLSGRCGACNEHARTMVRSQLIFLLITMLL